MQRGKTERECQIMMTDKGRGAMLRPFIILYAILRHDTIIGGRGYLATPGRRYGYTWPHRACIARVNGV
jgi:hypothetical protein